MTKKSRNRKVINRKIKSLLKNPLLKDAMIDMYAQLVIYGNISDRQMDEYVDKIIKAETK